MIAYTVLLYTAGVDAINISSDDSGSVVLFPSKIYLSVILNDSNISSSTSMLVVSWLCLFILSVHDIYHNNLCLFCLSCP